MWAMRTKPLSAGAAARLLEALPPRLRERLRGNGGPCQQSLWAYSLLRHAFQESYGAEMPEISWLPEGKPVFLERAGIHFNISHTEGAVLVGLSPEEIGVDIEKDREAPPRLQKLLQPGGEPFFSAWVCWEACAKCRGQGILSLLREGTLPDPMGYQSLEIFPGYWAGMAVLGEVSQPLIWRVEPDTLFDET